MKFPGISFRTRLTIAYAVLIGFVLTLATSRLSGVALGIAIAAVLGASWAIGRWITQKVVLAAYQGAAAQVATALAERERNDQRLRLILGEAGHEMRTPLTVISAYLELLDGDADEDPARRKSALTMLRSETRRLRELVERVMALARLDGGEGKVELVDVAAEVRDTIAEIVTARGGDVHLHAPQDDLVVRCEPWALREAVGNLVDNALKYGGGTLVDVTATALAGRVIVRVSDCGPGIAADDRERLFRHFFRGEQADVAPGSGLGLAIVSKAAERLGGDVVLERPGPPVTTFRLSMPAYRHAPALIFGR